MLQLLLVGLGLGKVLLQTGLLLVQLLLVHLQLHFILVLSSNLRVELVDLSSELVLLFPHCALVLSALILKLLRQFRVLKLN